MKEAKTRLTCGSLLNDSGKRSHQRQRNPRKLVGRVLQVTAEVKMIIKCKVTYFFPLNKAAYVNMLVLHLSMHASGVTTLKLCSSNL